MSNHRRQTWIAVSLCFVLIQTAITTPVYVPQFLPTGTGRNIRHLPCVSRRTGETGICMFAFTCAKANGTHLGTCIDRFYFGSCCKIDEEPDVGPQDNSIDDGPPAASRPFVTTHGPIESNDIPAYFPRPKPTQDQSTKSPETYTSVGNTIATQSTESTVAVYGESTKTSTKIVTKRPSTEPIETTTQSTRLSTFQTVQNASDERLGTSAPYESTAKTTTEGTRYSPSSSSSLTTSKLTVETTQKPTTPLKSSTMPSSSLSPSPSSSSTTTKRPNVGTSKPITKKPIHTTVSSTIVQTSFQRPIQTTTTKSVVATTEKVQPPTRFPPRNTTSVKPVTQPSTKRPPTVSTKRPHLTSTKRPVSSTKKPSSPTKKPSTTLATSSSSWSHGTKPTIGTSTSSTYATSIKVKPTSTTTERTVVSTTSGSLATQTSYSSRKPIGTTTERPVHHKTTSRPKPTTTPGPLVTAVTGTKPTKIGTTTVQTTTGRPRIPSTTEKTTYQASTGSSILEITKPSSTKTPAGTTIKPVRITTPTTSSIPSFHSSSTTSVSTLHTSTSKVPLVDQTLEEVPQTTASPGLVTWSSHSNETPTKPPELTSTTKVHEEITESEWTPITTPDGWVMIQSPTTAETLSTSQESSTSKLESVTVASSVPAKSTTESVATTTTTPTTTTTTTTTTTKKTTTERPTESPAILTTLSSIATIAVDTETTISMESLNMSDYKQVCGRRLFPQSRIVGGSRSSFGQWPWQISLRQWKTSTYLHKCGAALLNENWAITAAHCVENVSPADILLRIGDHDLANEEEPYGFQERRVQIIASHPQFDPRTFEYDLALLRFYEPLPTFQPNVLPICLPDDDETYVGRTAYVTGWGRLYDEGPLPSVLQEVAVPVINNTVCEAMYRNAGYIEHIPHIFICAGRRNGGFDSCEGDSGGPMVIQRARDKRWILAGIISWGIGCAVPNQPGVYTRISEFREWINQILQF